MQVVSGLSAPPVFCPIVDDYYSGMEVTVPLRMELLPGVTRPRSPRPWPTTTPAEPLFIVHPLGQLPADGMLAAGALQGSDRIELFCTASPDGSQMLLISLFDNLGKGFVGRGGPVHESDAGPGRNGRPRMTARRAKPLCPTTM